jgi:hypothetical protein
MAERRVPRRRIRYARPAIRASTTAALLMFAAIADAPAFPVHGNQTISPRRNRAQRRLAFTAVREVFKSEAIGGAKSYLPNLGDLAFSSPTILGGLPRQAGISCSTYHVNGASNPRLYIPSLSTRPGTFDTTGGLFNTKATALTSGPAFGATIRCCRHGSFICGQHL